MNLTRLVAEQARIRAGDRVCDIGCGYGTTALMLNRDYGAQVTGITISSKQYAHAQRVAKANPAVDFLLGDALKNDLPSDAFDAVIAIESTEHMRAKAKLFSEARRLLRSDGRLVMAVWLSREQPAAWESNYLLEPICAEGRLPSMMSASEYQALLETTGFRDLNFLDLTRLVKRTWTLCACRLVKRFLLDSHLRRRLFDPHFANRVFAKTVFRIRLAYETGAMRYGVFTARK